MSDRLKIILTILVVGAVTALAILLVKTPEAPAPQSEAEQTAEAGPALPTDM